MDENSALQTIKPDEHQYQRNLRIEWEAEKKKDIQCSAKSIQKMRYM